MLKKFFFVCLLALCAPAAVFAGGVAPQWLQQAAAIKAPSYDKDIQASCWSTISKSRSAQMDT